MRPIRFARRAAGITGPHNIFGTQISFAGGLAYPHGLPDLTAEAQTALTVFRAQSLQYGPIPGLPELREQLTALVAEDGVRVTPEQILIVNGAKQGLDLVCKVLVEPGDTVVVTTPTYMSAIGILRGHEVKFLEVPQDDEGLDVAMLAERLREIDRRGEPLPKLVYDVPDFHNPTAITMSRRRREALVALADEYGLVVVEDDPYRRLRFEGESVPPIQSFDRARRVISLGTFSKLVSPGLRVGWVTGPKEIVDKMAVLKTDGGSCPLTQRIILEFLKGGQLPRHTRDLVKIYTERRDVMVRELGVRLPRTSCRLPQGGYYVWLRLPDEWDADHILPAALRHGVRYYPASTFYATKGPANFMRLSYSFCTVEEIQEGVRRLADAVAESYGASG